MTRFDTDPNGQKRDAPSGTGSRPSGRASKAVSPVPASIPSAVKPKAELDLAALSALVEKATQGPWRIDRGGCNLFDNVWITAYEREGYKRDHNPICSVSTKQRHYKSDKDAYGNRSG